MARDRGARGIAGSAYAMLFGPSGVVATVKPSGSADQTAINAAIAAVSAVGGGTVQLVAGEYAISDCVSMANSVELRGVGYGTHLKLAASTTKNVIQAVSATNIAIRNLRVDGNRSNNTDPLTSADNVQNGICAWGCNGIEISGVWSHDAIFHGIFIRDAADNLNVKILNNYLYRNGYRACHVHGTDTNTIDYVMVRGNICWENGQEAASQTTGNSGIFAVFQNARFVQVSNNIVWGDTGYGIEVGGVFGAYTIGVENCSIADNIVSGCGWSGIRITNGVSKLLVANNVVANSANHGIILTNSSSGMTNEGISIVGNVVSENTENGIHISGTTGSVNRDLLIAQNSCFDNGSVGINLGNSSSYYAVSIFANSVRGNGSRGLQIAKGAAYTVKDISITANTFRGNATGALDMDGVEGFAFSGNIIRDNTVESGSNTSVSITACSKGIISLNRVAHVDLTATGSGMYIGDTSSDILIDANIINVGGAGIFCQGSNIDIERTRGGSQLNLGSLSDNCRLTENRNSNNPYYVDNGTGNAARRFVIAAPATASSAGVKGDEAYDSGGNHYKCTASNTWVKAAYATF